MEPIVIVGGCAAGLMAAAHLPTADVIILEQLPRPGIKLLATGGGRCNLTHHNTVDELCRAFGKQGNFARQIFQNFPPSAIEDFFRLHGCPTYTQPDGCVYPASNRAQDVLKALHRATTHAKIICNTKVTGLDRQKILTSKGDFKASALILATGGRAQPALGSDGSLLNLLAEKNIPITPLRPALTPLALTNPLPELAGISLPNAQVTLHRHSSKRPIANATGPILFTHQGISGPAILNLSREVQPSDILSINYANLTPSQWHEQIANWRREKGVCNLLTLLYQYLPARLSNHILDLIPIPRDRRLAQLTRTEIDKLVVELTSATHHISGTEGWHRAMVTAGGVSLKALNPLTLQLRSDPHTFCIGELIDLDGPCGGYNLTLSFATAYTAACAIRKQFAL